VRDRGDCWRILGAWARHWDTEAPGCPRPRGRGARVPRNTRVPHCRRERGCSRLGGGVIQTSLSTEDEELLCAALGEGAAVD
jgi:hypothetical protein